MKLIRQINSQQPSDGSELKREIQTKNLIFNELLSFHKKWARIPRMKYETK